MPLVRYTVGDVVPVLNQLSTPAFTLGYRAVDLAQLNWLPSDQIGVDTHERIARARDGLLRAAMCQIACLACLPAAQRLYVELLRCAQMMGARHFVMPTHGDLASRVCTTRETISRELSILRREGVLSSGRNVRLLAPGDLVKRIARTLNLDRDTDVWESIGIAPADAS